MANSGKLLKVQPQELCFSFELMKPASCTIRLSTNSRRHVAFKVMTTSPEKYFVRPNIGILSPGSTCDIEVNMRPVEEIPRNMECKDKFLIKSVVASPDDTVERSRKLFNDRGTAVEECKLKVLYVIPSHQQLSSLGTPGEASSSSNGSILQQTSLSGSQGRKEMVVNNLLVRGIIILFLSLVFLYLVIMKILPVIWSGTLVVSLLVIKMAKRLVSDSVEDWIMKTLFYACIHFFTVIFRRRNTRPRQESTVSVVG